MVRNVYIDGVDVRATYGVWILKGGYNDLFLFPALKKPDTNDWPEHNGLEVDLSDPKLAAWAVKLDFVASRTAADPSGFVQMLSAPGYHEFSFPSLSRSFFMRLDDSVDYKKCSNLHAFRLQFAVDEPSRPELYAWMPPGIRICNSAYTLDGIGFDQYGVFVQAGRDSLLQPPPLKEQMKRNKISVIDGQLYDADQVRFGGKTVTLQCCLKASDMTRLWSCRDAFFGAWTAAGEHILTYYGNSFRCFYEQTTNARLACMRSGLCMITFDLRICIIDGQ